MKRFNELYNWMLFLISFIIVALPRLSAIAIIVMILLQIYGLLKKEVRFVFNPLLVLILLFYIAYFIGAIFTDYPDIAGKYLEYKLSFLLFPLLFSFRIKERIAIEKIGLGLILAAVYIAIMGFIHSISCYNNNQSLNCFFSSEFSYIHHPSYAAVYYLFAATVAFYGWRERWKSYNLKWVIPFIVFSLIAHFLCMSLAGLLYLFILLFALSVWFVYKKCGVLSLPKWGKIALFVGLICMPLAILFALNNIPGLNTQLTTSKEYLKEYMDDPYAFVKSKQTYVGGNETRLILWTASWLELKNHPFGVGTGNVDEHMRKRLIELGQSTMAEKNYNSHNQYLQTGIEIGWIGLLLLLSILVIGIITAFKDKNWLLLVLISNLAFNMLFESMLQRQSGIVFYTFWICILVVLESKSYHRINEEV